MRFKSQSGLRSVKSESTWQLESKLPGDRTRRSENHGEVKPVRPVHLMSPGIENI